MKLDEFKKILGSKPWESTPQKQQELRELLFRQGLDMSNLFLELEMSSRYVNTHRAVSYAGSPVSQHNHDFYELLYCESSASVEYLVGTKRYLLQPGDMIIIYPNVVHGPIIPKEMAEPYRRIVVWLSKDFVKHFCRTFRVNKTQEKNGHLFLRTAGTEWEKIGDYFCISVDEAERQETDWEGYVVGTIMVALSLLQRAVDQTYSHPVVQPEKPELLDRVIAYIEDHLAEPIDLAGTARTFWVSESTISQIFRKKMGSSFHRFLTQRRLIEAKSLIINGMPLQETSTAVGFSDYSTFYRAFKREYGFSPREFLQLYTSMPSSQKDPD